MTCHCIAISETCKFQDIKATYGHIKFHVKCFKYLVLKPNPLVLQSNLFLRVQSFHPNFQTCGHAHVIRLNITSLKICKLCSGAITALASSRSSLISASEDCWICIWDIFRWEMTRRFSLHKGNSQSKYVFISIHLMIGI